MKEVKEQKLFEKNWKYVLPNTLRKFIASDDYASVLETLKMYANMLWDKEIGFFNETQYDDFIADIDNQMDNLDNYEEYDMTIEDVTEEIDYLLDKFYDICDADDIFIDL